MADINGACTSAAFFMEGLHDVGYGEVIDAWSNGVLELIQELVSYAPLADELCSEGFKAAGLRNEGLVGVFDYEVSSPFGKWFALHVIQFNDTPTAAEADAQLRHLSDLFMNQ